MLGNQYLRAWSRKARRSCNEKFGSLLINQDGRVKVTPGTYQDDEIPLKAIIGSDLEGSSLILISNFANRFPEVAQPQKPAETNGN